MPNNECAQLYYSMILPFTDIKFFRDRNVSKDMMQSVFNVALSIPNLNGSNTMCAEYRVLWGIIVPIMN